MTLVQVQGGFVINVSWLCEVVRLSQHLPAIFFIRDHFHWPLLTGIASALLAVAPDVPAMESHRLCIESVVFLSFQNACGDWHSHDMSLDAHLDQLLNLSRLLGSDLHHNFSSHTRSDLTGLVIHIHKFAL